MNDVPVTSVIVWPEGIVTLPATTATLFRLNGIGSIVAGNASVALFTSSVPVPVVVPLARSSVPPVTVHVRPLPIVTVPVFVKLGVVPVCDTVRFPALIAIVPLFTCTAPARPSVSVWVPPIVSVLWLSSCTASVRGPLAPVSGVIVAPGAFVTVPAGTVRVAPYPAFTSVSSIVPTFVKPVVTVSAPAPYAALPCTRSVDPAVVVSAPPKVTVPCASSSP